MNNQNKRLNTVSGTNHATTAATRNIAEDSLKLLNCPSITTKWFIGERKLRLPKMRTLQLSLFLNNINFLFGAESEFTWLVSGGSRNEVIKLRSKILFSFRFLC